MTNETIANSTTLNESNAISDGILIQTSSATAADLSANDLKQIDIECQMPPSYERVVAAASSSAIDLQAGYFFF